MTQRDFWGLRTFPKTDFKSTTSISIRTLDLNRHTAEALVAGKPDSGDQAGGSDLKGTLKSAGIFRGLDSGFSCVAKSVRNI